MCQLCGANWLFVVATGRSGSTTVLEMLNALPMVYLAGENGGILTAIRKLYNNQIQALISKKTTAGGAWSHAKINNQRVLCAIQKMTKSIMGEFTTKRSPRMIGFKEIRYDYSEDLAFLQRVFPCARFVVNTRRNLKEQAGSAFYETFKNAQSKAKEKTGVLKAWRSKFNPKRTFLLELEDFTTDKFNEMLKWLKVTGCKYTSVAHANNGGYGVDQKGVKMRGYCQFHGYNK